MLDDVYTFLFFGMKSRFPPRPNLLFTKQCMGYAESVYVGTGMRFRKKPYHR
jgi:hypothetical protein